MKRVFMHEQGNFHKPFGIGCSQGGLLSHEGIVACCVGYEEGALPERTVFVCDTPGAVISGRASEQRQQRGLPPEGPALEAVVELRAHSNNGGACLPYYSLPWLGQDGDT
jgi:hypothetical protein